MQKSIFYALFCFPLWAKASYVESCFLHFQLTAPPEIIRFSFNDNEGREREKTKLSVKGKILSVDNGLKDSLCRQFHRGEETSIMLENKHNFKEGQIIYVSYLFKDNRGMPPMESYQYIEPMKKEDVKQ